MTLGRVDGRTLLCLVGLVLGFLLGKIEGILLGVTLGLVDGKMFVGLVGLVLGFLLGGIFEGILLGKMEGI